MARAKTPTADQLRLAAEWLDCNEADGDEQSDCFAVRDWLRGQAEAIEQKKLARECGLTVSRLRELISAN